MSALTIWIALAVLAFVAVAIGTVYLLAKLADENKPWGTRKKSPLQGLRVN